MIPAEELQQIEKGLKVLKVIWTAMLLSLGLYLVVGMSVRGNVNIGMDKGLMDMVRNVLYVVSFVILVSTRFAIKPFLSGSLASPSSGGQSTVLARYSTSMIIALAMSETIGVFGLVLYLMGGNDADLYLFLLISAAAMIAYRPRREELLRLAEETGRQQGRS